MKKLLFLSGKGGTGKTTTAASFVAFSQAKAVADCDVDAPNLHLVMDTSATPRQTDYYGSQKAFIDQTACQQCGECAKHCRFEAVQRVDGRYQINPYACEGCGVCEYVCPHRAVGLQEDVAGKLSLYQADSTFSTAILKMGRGNSGKLVSEVKSALFAVSEEQELALIDGSPGVGCPVIASMSGVDLVLLVAEPSISGISDLQRIVQTASIFRTKVAVCVNKYDTSLESTAQIERYCKEQEIAFVGKIPYDKKASEAINAGKSLAEVDCEATTALRAVYQKTMQVLNEVTA